MKAHALLLCLTLAGGTARGAEPAGEVRATAPAQLRVLHAPPVYATNGPEDLILPLRILNSFLAREVLVQYRHVGERAFAKAPAQKSSSGDWVARIPAEVVAAPGFEYYVETVMKDGSTVPNFASASRPHRVIVHDLSPEQRRARRLARHNGLRYDLSVGYRYVSAGLKELPTSPNGDTRSYRESYNELGVSFSYRILSDYIYQISFSFGAMGAKLGMSRPLAERASDPATDPSLRGEAAPTGLYFGKASATWEISSLVGLDLSAILGANQVGFAVGGGGTLRLGRLSGTHLDIGAEVIQNTGYDVHFEFAWDTVPRVMMSLRADLTTYPSENDGLAVIPSFNVRWALSREAYVTALIGYGTRFQYQRGGVTAGAGFGYQF
jgi:hypothetical protein